MKSNLEIALELIAHDIPLPVDLEAALLDEGIDVDALEASDAADAQLSLIPLLDDTLEQ